MYRICITDHFDAAHHLVGYQGACAYVWLHCLIPYLYYNQSTCVYRGIRNALGKV